MTLTYQIPQSLIDEYSAGPSATRTSQVKNLHENIRFALENWGEKKFDTFLQGSYRNDTAIKDINDVDIVALYYPWSRPVSHSEWEWLFNHIASILRKTTLVQGSVKLGDKCVKLEGSLKADIVPAISQSPYSSTDPVYIYSRRNCKDCPNLPRTHYANGVLKQKYTDGSYKATVRLFKRWARQYATLVAPSFYIECAVHSVPANKFDGYLPLSFASVGVELSQYTSNTIIKSVAGDKDILVANEWCPSDFRDFQNRLRRDVGLVMDAMQSLTQDDASRRWRLAFGD